MAASLPLGRKQLRTFTLIVALPTVLLYVASAALVMGALVMMAGEIDRLEKSRGVVAMHAALNGFLAGLSDAASDEGAWDEAYLNVVVKPDPAWMDTTWGASARFGTTYDTVLITDSAGIIQFGETNAGAIKGDIASVFPAARKMLHNLDKGISATGDATAVSAFAADEQGLAGLAAISIHLSGPGNMSVPRQQRQVLWIARHITPALLQEIAVRYQAPLATLVQTVDSSSSSIALADADGNVAGTIAWTPDRPGDTAFSYAGLIASATFFGIGVVLALWLGIVRRAMLKRAATIGAAAVEAHQQVQASAPPPVATHTRRLDDEPAMAGPIDEVTASEFSIEYQPIFDLRAQTMIGVEGLLRWARPDKSILTYESLSSERAAGLLQRVGILALRHASDELAPLLGLMVTLAATPGQLLSPVFAEKIVGTLAATRMPARRLQLCLDAALLPPADRLAPVLASLRSSGVVIALGNFTLDAHNLDYVRFGLADRIRLAPSMAAGLDGDPLRRSLVETTIEAARNAKLVVTVPGIDNKADVAPLLRLGCREFQGALFAAPMGISALTNLVLASPVEVRQAG